MTDLLSRIEGMMNYLLSLGYFVSMHFKSDVIKKLNYSAWQRLLPYNSHNHPYCLAVKCARAGDCVRYQASLISSLGCDMKIVSCYAGVRECVYPVTIDGVIIGYIALGGYRDDDCEPITGMPTDRESLIDSDIPVDMASALLPALASMIEDVFGGSMSNEDNEENMMSQYLQENHANITFDEFCAHFSRSRSYMSHAFRRIFGSSFSEYCNRLRLADAEKMLTNSELSITDIALGAGFGDVSYFIKLFKSQYGVSPLRYRKNNRR